MEPNFIIVKRPEPIALLLEKFPELQDLQQYADMGSYYVYNRFAEHLRSQPDDEQLWRRACGLFDMLATGGSDLEDLLGDVFESLRMDATIAAKLKAGVGPAVARLLTERPGLL